MAAFEASFRLLIWLNENVQSLAPFLAMAAFKASFMLLIWLNENVLSRARMRWGRMGVEK